MNRCGIALSSLTFNYFAQKILLECHQYRNVVAFTIALILNCVHSNSTAASEVEEVATRRVDLVGRAGNTTISPNYLLTFLTIP